MPWRVDQSVLDEFAKRLGLKHPAVVTKTRYKLPFYGRYVDFRDGRHRIALETRMPVAVATFVLLHELGHAVQAERVGNDRKAFDREWMAGAHSVGITTKALRAGTFDPAVYDQIPMEAEVNDLADAHFEAAILAALIR